VFQEALRLRGRLIALRIGVLVVGVCEVVPHIEVLVGALVG
jgi:hypothetical protein